MYHQDDDPFYIPSISLSTKLALDDVTARAGHAAEKIVEVGATSEATKKLEADLSCCTRPPASDETQQITTKKKHSWGDELRGKISRQEESGGVRD